MAQLDPYNLRITRQETRCLSGATIAPGLVGFCHETPISAELLVRQAPELAMIQMLLAELRCSSSLLATFEVVEKYRRWADRTLGPADLPVAFPESDLCDRENRAGREPPCPPRAPLPASSQPRA